MFKIAEFLDGRVAFSFDTDDEFLELFTEMKKMAFMAEVEPIPSIHDTPVVPGDAFGRLLKKGTPKPQPAAARRAAAAVEDEYGPDCQFRRDFFAYVAHLHNLGEEYLLGLDPLEYWAVHGSKFPIIARIAAQILAIPATSADVERLFSITGRILTKYRASLKAERIDMITCLHGWLKDDYEATYGKPDKRTEKRAKANARFAELNIRLEIDAGEEESDDEEEEVAQEPEDE